MKMIMKMKQIATWRNHADNLLQTLHGDVARKKYLAAVTALIDGYETVGHKSFKNKFELGVGRNKVSDILTNLHNHKAIFVSSDIRQTKPKSNTPVVTLAYSITDDPSIADSSWTDFRVNVDALRYLQHKLGQKKEQKAVYSCGLLSVNFDTGTMQFGRKPQIEISQNTREIKFLRLLMNRNGDTVKYSEFARELGLLTDTHSKDYASDMQTVKRDLINKVLKKAGMKSTDIKQMIHTKTKVGYALRCPKE